MEKEKSNRVLLQLFIYFFYKSCIKFCKILKSQTVDMVSDYWSVKKLC